MPTHSSTRSTSGASELKALTARPHTAPGKDVGAQGLLFPRTVPQLTGTLSPKHLWVPRTPQGQHHPKGFDNWFHGLEHCVSWFRIPWHSSPMLPVRNAILGIETLLLPSCGGCQGSLFPLELRGAVHQTASGQTHDCWNEWGCVSPGNHRITSCQAEKICEFLLAQIATSPEIWCKLSP